MLPTSLAGRATGLALDLALTLRYYQDTDDWTGIGWLTLFECASSTESTLHVACDRSGDDALDL